MAPPLCHEVLPAAGAESIDRLAADFQLTRQEAEHLVVGKLVLAFFFRPLDDGEHHAQRIQAHGRSCDRIAAFSSVLSRSRRDTGVAPRRQTVDNSVPRTLRRRDGRA